MTTMATGQTIGACGENAIEQKKLLYHEISTLLFQHARSLRLLSAWKLSHLLRFSD